MDLRQLRYFMAVAEERSFSRAARRLHVSQPPLSVHIKRLEDDLRVQLFERTNRGVELSRAGQVFYEEIEAVLRKLDQAKVKAQSAAAGEGGTLAIGFVSIADYSVLPPALKRFRDQFPKVDVQLHELTTDAQIEELRRGRLDIGIGLGPVDETDLRFEPLLHERLLLAAPRKHALLRKAGPVRLKAFADENFIVPPRDLAPGLYDLILSQCRASGFSPRINQHARQMQTVIGLVASGMGCALVPSSVKNLKRAGVQYRLLSGPAASVTLGVLRAAEEDSVVVNNFVLTLNRFSRGP